MSAPDQDRRTHAPTPKRVKEFRKRGEIARSRDLTTTATLAGGLVACVAFSGTMRASVEGLMRRSFDGFGVADPGLPDGAVAAFATACLPAVCGALIGYLVTALCQLGWPPAIRWPRLQLGKPFTVDSIKNILSPPAMAKRALQSSAKVVLVGVAGALAVRDELQRFIAQPALEAGGFGHRAVAAASRLIAYAGLVLVALAAFDYWWQRRQLMAKMRMTPEELKREHREQEGDPHVRRERKRRQRELARRRLAVEVERADVVIVNPTRYAVALRYRADESTAPMVLAKGRGPVAQRIRDIARAAQIPILSRPPLTRLIYKLVPEGREIPAQVYQAVAEVLAFVYRVRQRRLA